MKVSAAPKLCSSRGVSTNCIKVARIFNTFAAHASTRWEVGVTHIQAPLGRDITIYGDGSQARSFCYVEDLVDGLIRLMGSPDEIVGPINIGNPVEFSMLQLANIVCELTGSRSGIVHRPLPQDDPRQRQPDIAKAQEFLGWKPTTPLREGLAKTIAYFEALLHEPGIMEVVGNGERA
jgi:UDP-glucuronate decarboxylase